MGATAAIVELKSVVCCGYAADSELLFVMDDVESDVACGCDLAPKLIGSYHSMVPL